MVYLVTPSWTVIQQIADKGKNKISILVSNSNFKLSMWPEKPATIYLPDVV